MVDVLLIVPPAGRPYPPDFKPFAPPLGLAYLASALRQAGFSSMIIDYYVRPFGKRDFYRLLSLQMPKVVGMSSYTENFSGAMMIAGHVKRFDGGIRTVLGGPHVSRLPADGSLSPDIDAVIRGEGEASLVELVGRWLSFKDDKNPIPGTTFRDRGGNIVASHEGPVLLDPELIPEPARDLLDSGVYTMGSSMLTSRGCGMSCIFCVSGRGGGNRLRLLPDGRVISELRRILAGETVKHVHFWDETFTADRDRTLRLCQRFTGELRRFTWSAGTRVDMVDEALLRAMRRAGCTALNFGVESGDPVVLRSTGKGITLDQVNASLEMCIKEDIHTTYNFMIPAPEDTPETIRRTFRYAIKLLDDGAGGVSFNISTPFPGTMLYEKAEELGIRIHGARWDDYHYWNPVMSTCHLDREAIRELYFEIIVELMERKKVKAQ